MTSRSRWIRTASLSMLLAFASTPAFAQIVQNIHVGFGAFFPRSQDTRTAGDVLTTDLTAGFNDQLAFDIGRFKSGHVFGEWNVGLGQHIEAGIGVGYYSDTIPSISANLVNTATGNDIRQRLHLRMIPVTALVRFLPFGRPNKFQPYAGVGISAIRWRYIEAGEFIDTDGVTIFTPQGGGFVARGTTAVPVVVLGARAPVGGDIYALTIEWRYQVGAGNIPQNSGFLPGATKIDLTGGSLNFGFLVRF